MEKVKAIYSVGESDGMHSTRVVNPNKKENAELKQDLQWDLKQTRVSRKKREKITSFGNCVPE